MVFVCVCGHFRVFRGILVILEIVEYFLGFGGNLVILGLARVFF